VKSLLFLVQETSVLGVHMAGAALTFGFGTVYEFMQTYVSYKMHPEVNGRPVCHARLVISVISAAALLGSKFAHAASSEVLLELSVLMNFFWCLGFKLIFVSVDCQVAMPNACFF